MNLSSIPHYCIKFWHYWPSKLLTKLTLLLLHHILTLVTSKFLTKWTCLVYPIIASNFDTIYPQNFWQHKRFCYIVTLRSRPADSAVVRTFFILTILHTKFLSLPHKSYTQNLLILPHKFLPHMIIQDLMFINLTEIVQPTCLFRTTQLLGLLE